MESQTIFLLDILPEEIIFIIATYVNKVGCIKSLSETSAIMFHFIFKYNKYKRKGILNPFLKKNPDVTLSRNDNTDHYNYITNYYCGNNTIAKFSQDMSDKFDGIVFTNIKRIFFLYLTKVSDIKKRKDVRMNSPPKSDPSYSGVIIYKDTKNKIVCTIKLRYIWETFSGENWFQMWKQLSENHITFIFKRNWEAELYNGE